MFNSKSAGIYEPCKHVCIHEVNDAVTVSPQAPTDTYLSLIPFLKVKKGDRLHLLGSMAMEPYDHFYSPTTNTAGFLHQNTTTCVSIQKEKRNKYTNHQIIAGSSGEKMIEEFCLRLSKASITESEELSFDPPPYEFPDSFVFPRADKKKQKHIRRRTLAKTMLKKFHSLTKPTVTFWSGQKMHCTQPYAKSILNILTPLDKYLTSHNWEGNFHSKALEVRAATNLSTYTLDEQKSWKVWKDSSNADFIKVFKRIKTYCGEDVSNPLLLEMCVVLNERWNQTEDVADYFQPHSSITDTAKKQPKFKKSRSLITKEETLHENFWEPYSSHFGVVNETSDEELAIGKSVSSEINQEESVFYGVSEEFVPVTAVSSHFPDEDDDSDLLLEVGDVVYISKLYEDGWGRGLNARTNMVGDFPLSAIKNLESDSINTSTATLQIINDISVSGSSSTLAKDLEAELQEESPSTNEHPLRSESNFDMGPVHVPFFIDVLGDGNLLGLTDTHESDVSSQGEGSQKVPMGEIIELDVCVFETSAENASNFDRFVTMCIALCKLPSFKAAFLTAVIFEYLYPMSNEEYFGPDEAVEDHLWDILTNLRKALRNPEKHMEYVLPLLEGFDYTVEKGSMKAYTKFIRRIVGEDLANAIKSVFRRNPKSFATGKPPFSGVYASSQTDPISLSSETIRVRYAYHSEDGVNFPFESFESANTPDMSPLDEELEFNLVPSSETVVLSVNANVDKIERHEQKLTYLAHLESGFREKVLRLEKDVFPLSDYECRRRKNYHDIFISYKTEHNSELVREWIINSLFEINISRMSNSQRELHWFVDEDCLEDGQYLTDEFLDVLLHAKVIFLLVTERSLRKLNFGGDNALLEWEWALHLKNLHSRRKFRVQPLFIGTKDVDAAYSKEFNFRVVDELCSVNDLTQVHPHPKSPRQHSLEDVLKNVTGIKGSNLVLNRKSIINELRVMLEYDHTFRSILA